MSETTESSQVGAAASGRAQWPRSARVSLGSFLAASGLLPVGLLVMLAGYRNEWIMFSVDEPYEAIGGTCMLLGVAAVLTSVVSGFVAVRRRPVVLWWVIPLMAAIAWLVCLTI